MSTTDEPILDVADAGTPDEELPSVKVRVHPGLCEGWGECHRWAPEVYSLGPDGKVDLHLVEVPGELALKAWLGARACPEQAITLIGPPEEYWLERFRNRHRVRDRVRHDHGDGTP
jgi:ferredoxin